MRKLLVLVFVAVMCVPSYGSILVYKTTQAATVFDVTGATPMSKVTQKGYLVLDVNLATQTVNGDAYQITYSGTTQKALVAAVVFYNVAGYIVADYSSDNIDAVLSGKTSLTNIGLANKEPVATSLKGYTVDLVSPDLSSGTLTATLDTKTTKTSNVSSSNIVTVVNTIVSGLPSKYASTPDATPPDPNPATWAIEPTALSNTQITMTATEETDALTPPVEYYFANKTVSGHDSGWQSEKSYTDKVLDPNTNYGYTVMARDSKAPVPNVTLPSADINATTYAVADTNVPEPNKAAFATVPTARSDTSITMIAVTETEAQGVQYYFANKTATGHDSGWQDSPAWADNGLTPDTNYGYTVKAQSKALVPYATAESNEANAVTFADATAPQPNPMTFLVLPTAAGPHAIRMQATIATDDAPGTIQYRFYRAAPIGNTQLFGWQTDSNFTDTGLTEGTSYSYQVQAEDAADNNTAWSIAQSITTPTTIQTQINAVRALRQLSTPGLYPAAAGIVNIAAGTYNESIDINEPNITLRGAGAATTIIEPGANYQQAVEVNTGATGAVIDGFTIKHGTQAYTAANPEQSTIWVHADYSTIENCTIDTNSGNWAGIFIGGRKAGVLKGTHTPIWDYNVATGTKGHSILNNTIRSGVAGNGWGIYAFKLTDDCNISGNTISGDANDMLHWDTPGNEGGVGTAIEIHSAQKGNGTYAVTIQNNTSQYLKYSWLTFTTEVPYNDIVGYMYTQGENSEVNDVLVQNNTADDLGQDGVHKNGVGVTFSGKTDSSYEPNTSDLTIGAGKVTITGNTFSNNQYGVRVKGPSSLLSGAYGCVLQANKILVSTDNAIYGNVLAGLYNGTIETNQDGGPVTINAELNWWGAATGPQQATTNTSGAGNAVSDSVDYTHWYLSSAMDVNN
ncbi:MAG: hypothetical protein ABSG82_03865 [Sedimentisphaerales bacterium]|jgi:hypothetical protein